MTNEDWGPWIEHDGSGCPSPGSYGQIVKSCCGYGFFSNGKEEVIIEEVFRPDMSSWDWGNFLLPSKKGGCVSKVIRYRIRKPRGLTILENLIADIPEPVEMNQ